MDKDHDYSVIFLNREGHDYFFGQYCMFFSKKKRCATENFEMSP